MTSLIWYQLDIKPDRTKTLGIRACKTSSTMDSGALIINEEGGQVQVTLWVGKMVESSVNQDVTESSRMEAGGQN